MRTQGYDHASHRLDDCRVVGRNDTRAFEPAHRGGAVAISVVLVIFSGHAASPQTRTIKIVVPGSPGGVNDTLARLLGDQISRAQGQTILIENRAGAGGVIGAEAVSRAAPDGNTLLMTSPDMLIPPHLRKLNFDLLTSFEPKRWGDGFRCEPVGA